MSRRNRGRGRPAPPNRKALASLVMAGRGDGRSLVERLNEELAGEPDERKEAA